MFEFLYFFFSGSDCNIELFVNEFPVGRYEIHEGIEKMGIMNSYLIGGENKIRVVSDNPSMLSCEVGMNVKSYEKGNVITPDDGKVFSLYYYDEKGNKIISEHGRPIYIDKDYYFSFDGIDFQEIRFLGYEDISDEEAEDYSVEVIKAFESQDLNLFMPYLRYIIAANAIAYDQKSEQVESSLRRVIAKGMKLGLVEGVDLSDLVVKRWGNNKFVKVGVSSDYQDKLIVTDKSEGGSSYEFEFIFAKRNGEIFIVR